MHYVLNNTYLFEVLNSFAIMINYLYLQYFVFVISRIKAGKFFSEQGQADERVNEPWFIDPLSCPPSMLFSTSFSRSCLHHDASDGWVAQCRSRHCSKSKKMRKKFNKGSNMLEMKCYKYLASDIL